MTLLGHIGLVLNTSYTFVFVAFLRGKHLFLFLFPLPLLFIFLPSIQNTVTPMQGRKRNCNLFLYPLYLYYLLFSSFYLGHWNFLRGKHLFWFLFPLPLLFNFLPSIQNTVTPAQGRNRNCNLFLFFVPICFIPLLFIIFFLLSRTQELQRGAGIGIHIDENGSDRSGI